MYVKIASSKIKPNRNKKVATRRIPPLGNYAYPYKNSLVFWLKSICKFS